MSGYKDIQEKREEISRVARQYGVKSLRLFGSAARGEHTEASDFDFLADFEKGRSLFDLIALKEDIQNILQRPVDLMTPDSLHWSIKDQVLKESILISDDRQ